MSTFESGGRDPLALALSERYVIERELGRGGMATVYLARDLRHERNVALKVLHPDLAAALGAERFLVEIRTTANLQHPHILPLHDSGDANGHLFYVMPFVEGETLRARLEREGPLPIEVALRLTCEVLSALDYAHRHGVVHRDIKPENILLHDGSALVADFGIALAVQQAGGARMTQTGLSLGTPQYMSPEQAMGEKNIDGRADVYAAGAVLYEMLTAEPPFSGASVQAIVAKVMTERPVSPRTVRNTVPPHIEASVLKSLAKLPADRFASAAEFASVLADDRQTSTSSSRDASGHGGTRSITVRSAPWAVATLALGLLTAMGIYAADHAPVTPIVTHFDVTLPAGARVTPSEAGVVVAPDGDRVMFVAHAGNTTHLYLRELAGDSARIVAGSNGFWNAAFSPDGASIATRNGVGLLTLPVSGGAPTMLASGGTTAAPSWGSAGTIVYTSDGSVWAVGADGRNNRKLIAPDSTRGIVFLRQVDFLPSGDAFLVSIEHRAPQPATIGVGRLSGEVTDLGIAGGFPHYQPPGYVLFQSAPGQVSAIPFDARRLRATGRPLPVLDGVLSNGCCGPAVTVSADGRVAAYVRGSTGNRLMLVSPSGQETELPLPPGQYGPPRISPDGKRLATSRIATTGQDIWVVDLTTYAMTRLTTDGHMNRGPMWSRDGRRIAYAHALPDGFDIWQVAADGSSSPTPLLVRPGSQWPADWTPDGRTLTYDEIPPGHPGHVMALTDGVSRPIAEASDHGIQGGGISPDGRWFATTDWLPGGEEVFVRPLAVGATGLWQISLHGGKIPQWSSDGRTLYYSDGENVIAAAVEAKGSAFTVTDRRIFAPDRFSTESSGGYTIMPDGKHLLVVEPTTEPRYTVIVNWLDELRRKVAAGQ